MEKIDLSIVIPSYKSFGILNINLPLLLKYLKNTALAYEVVIVDDGSKDNNQTNDLALKNKCICIKSDVNKGKGNALRLGIEKAKGEYIVFTDADLPYDFKHLAIIYDILKKEEYKIVIGDRNLDESEYFEKTSKIRNFGSWLVAIFVSVFFYKNWKDTQCGLKGFDAIVAKSIFRKTKICRFAIDIEVIFLAVKSKIKIKKIPVVLRNNETSTVNIFKDGLQIIIDIIRIKKNDLTGVYEK